MAYNFAPDTPFYEEKGELPPIKSRKVIYNVPRPQSYNYSGLANVLTEAPINRGYNGSYPSVGERGFTGIKILPLAKLDPDSDKLINSEYGGFVTEPYVNDHNTKMIKSLIINDLNKCPEKGMFMLGKSTYNNISNVPASPEQWIYEKGIYDGLITYSDSNKSDLRFELDFSNEAKEWLFSFETPNGNIARSAVVKVNGINVVKDIFHLGVGRGIYDYTESQQYYNNFHWDSIIEKSFYEDYGYNVFGDKEYTDADSDMKGKTFFVYVAQNDDYVVVRSFYISDVKQHRNESDYYIYYSRSMGEPARRGNTGAPVRDYRYHTYYWYFNLGDLSVASANYFIIPKRNTWKKNHPTTGFKTSGSEYLPDLPINTIIQKEPVKYLSFISGIHSRSGDLWVSDDVSIETLERMINLCFYFLYNPKTDRQLLNFNDTHEIVNKNSRRKLNNIQYHKREVEILRNNVLPLKIWDKNNIDELDFKISSSSVETMYKRHSAEAPSVEFTREYLKKHLLTERPKPVRIIGSSQEYHDRSFKLLNLKYSKNYKKLNIEEILDSVKSVAYDYANAVQAHWGRRGTSYQNGNVSDYFLDPMFLRPDIGNMPGIIADTKREINSFRIKDIPSLERTMNVGSEITPYMLYYLILSISNIIYKRIVYKDNLYSFTEEKDHLRGCHSSTTCHSSCHGNCHSSSCHTVYVGSTYQNLPGGVGGLVHIMGSPDDVGKIHTKPGYFWDPSAARGR